MAAGVRPSSTRPDTPGIPGSPAVPPSDISGCSLSSPANDPEGYRHPACDPGDGTPCRHARRLHLLDLDLDVDAGGKVEALQAVDRLGGGLDDVEQALVDAHL